MTDARLAPPSPPEMTRPSGAPARPTPQWVAVNNDLGGPMPWVLLAISVFTAGVLAIVRRQGSLEQYDTATLLVWAFILGVAALAGISAAAQRDVVSWRTLIDALFVTAAIALFSWMYPRFDPDVPMWNDSLQLRLAVIGIGLGALTASIILLGLIRRPPSLASTSFLASLACLLGAQITAATNLVISTALIMLSFIGLSLSWSARPVGEPAWTPPERRLRVPRWIMSLTAAAAAASAIEVAVLRDRPVQPPWALIAAGFITALAIISVLLARGRMTHEQGAFGDWLSWERQQIDDDFETTMYTPPPPSRPLSEWTPEGELRLADDSFWEVLGIAPQTTFNFGSIAHPEDRPELAQALARGIGHRMPLEHTFRAVDPTNARQRVVRLSCTPSASGTVLVEATRIGRVEDPEHMIPGFDDPRLRDPLTGLRNTRYLDEWLQRYASENNRHTDDATLIIIESMPLERFDSLPALQQDLAVTEIGYTLDRACRDGDFCAHLDGPYFLVGARLGAKEDRDGLLARLTELLSTPLRLDPPIMPDERMVTLRVEPGVNLARVLGVAAAAFTRDI